MALYRSHEYQTSSESIGHSVQKSSKQIFKMAAAADILDFLSERLKLFSLFKSPQYFLPSFDNWPFGSGEVQNRFSKWTSRRPSWISDRNDFIYF